MPIINIQPITTNQITDTGLAPVSSVSTILHNLLLKKKMSK